MRLNDSGKYEEAKEILDGVPDLLETPLLMSHYALSKAGCGVDYKNALALCIRSLKSDITNPEIYFNLAKIYILSEKKAFAIKAMKKGLKYDPAHDGLKSLSDELGVRRKPAVGFLSRGSAINKSIGRMTYHKDKSKAKPNDDG
jgi:tetratricopeptide (TPR) repeat protein